MTSAVSISILTTLLVGAPVARAQEGALPKGRPEAAPGVKVQLQKTEGIKEDCHSYLATVPDGDAFYMPDGKSFYYLARLGAAPERYTLLRVTLEDLDKPIKSLISLALKRKGVLIPHGDPLVGFSVVSFKSGSRCHLGPGTAVGIPLDVKPGEKPKVAKSFPPGEYKMVPTATGRMLADLKAGYLRELDIRTYQRRQGPSFNAKESPVYFDDATKHMYTWDVTPPGSIYRYLLGKPTPQSQLKLTAGYKVIEDGEKFGVISFDNDANELTVHELAKWSSAANNHFKVKLPKEYPVSVVSVRVDFLRRLILITGNAAVGQKWDKVFLFHYKKGTLLGEFKAPDNHFIAHMSFVPGGKSVLATVHRADDSLQAMAVYGVEEKKWTPLKLPGDGA